MSLNPILQVDKKKKTTVNFAKATEGVDYESTGGY